MAKRDCLPRLAVALGLVFSSVAVDTFAATSVRANASRRVPIAESVHPVARAGNDAGAAAPGDWMEGRTLLLQRRSGSDVELERLLVEQQRFGSPLFRSWLTPEEFGRRFGIGDADLSALIEWLEGRASMSPRRLEDADG